MSTPSFCVSPSLTPRLESYGSKAFKLGRVARVVWIIHPQSFSSSDDGAPPDPPGYARAKTDRKLLTKLVSKYPGIPITIVNVGSNYHYGLYDFPNWRYLDNTEVLTSEEIFRKNFEGSKEEQELITFKTLSQFFEEENWKEWFDTKDVKEWIDMMDKLEKEDEARRGGSVPA
ncbi:hypothetical protein I302_100423 [Kwoniella bestiolae CBS 10118]|uniref:Uncharacterized protein n=1 Tax=Kwoniella bestiolae CBS 10118 TaxID=1296100 RepID=A0A1B9G540_9TREE|nr:hypothetical protein I302_03799 [Kwoniella bestiolae CBS 10118]OCF26122.1 hypothetical protein I302_03799 [Kwoniella bestiolae CBS 10118]